MGTLRVGFVPLYQPAYFLSPCATGGLHPRPGCEAPGLISEVLDLTIKMAGLKYDLIDFTGYAVEECILAFKNGSLDTITQLTPSNIGPNFTLSYPVMSRFPGFVTKAPNGGIDDLAWKPLKVFGPFLTVVLLISFGIFGLGQKCFRGNIKVVRTCCIFSAFLFVLFSNLYKGNLLAQLLVETRTERDYESILERIEEGKLQPLFQGFAEDWNLIKWNERHFTAKEIILRHTSEFTKPLFTGDYDMKTLANSLIRDENLVTVVDNEVSSVMRHSCELAFTPIPMEPETLAFIFEVGSPVMKSFNRALVQLQLRTESIVDKYDRIDEREAKCEADSSNTKEYKSLDFLSLSGVFGVLIAGEALSVLAVLIEKLVAKIKAPKICNYYFDNQNVPENGSELKEITNYVECIQQIIDAAKLNSHAEEEILSLLTETATKLLQKPKLNT